MRKKIYCFLLMIPVLIGLSSSASAQIVVEDASFIWEKALDSTEFPDISPRITAEYATTIFETDLIPPPDLELPARIIVEYATAIARFDLSSLSVCEGDFDQDGDVDGSDLAAFAAGGTTITLEEFATDFGKTNCPVYE